MENGFYCWILQVTVSCENMVSGRDVVMLSSKSNVVKA